MKSYPIYTDVPGVPGVSIWYDAHESRVLDRVLSGLIDALKADASWYSSVMIRARAGGVRITAICRPGLHLAFSAVAEIRLRDYSVEEIGKIVYQLRRELEGRAGMVA